MESKIKFKNGASSASRNSEKPLVKQRHFDQGKEDGNSTYTPLQKHNANGEIQVSVNCMMKANSSLIPISKFDAPSPHNSHERYHKQVMV